MNANAPDRQSRLAAALRENLKRRKRQTRVREAARPAGPPDDTARDEWQTAPAGARGPVEEPGPSDKPGPSDELKGSD